MHTEKARGIDKVLDFWNQLGEIESIELLQFWHERAYINQWRKESFQYKLTSAAGSEGRPKYVIKPTAKWTTGINFFYN